MPLWNLQRRDGHGVPLGRVERLDSARSCCRRRSATEPRRSGWSATTRGWDETDPRRMSSLRRVHELHRRPAGAEVPACRSIARSPPQGEPTYRTQCAACHDPGGARTGKVDPVERDRDRPAPARHVDHRRGCTPTTSTARATPGSSRSSARPTATPPCLSTACGCAAPYLHNGSVPTLADLLEPPEARPAKFWRGYDVFDAERVGFVSTGPEAERVRHVARRLAAGQQQRRSHYGTTLPAEAKRALIEFMKTL